MNIKIIAYQISETLNIKKLKQEFTGKNIYSSSFELFYETENSTYLYIFEYGVIVFAGYSAIEISKTLSYLKEFSGNPLGERFTEDFQISTGVPSANFSYNSLQVPDISPDIIRITMLNVGQSAALDYYSALTQSLLDGTVEMTDSLETAGKFRFSKNQLLKFIGRSMNLKRRIIDNIYILDEPETLWENEALNKINIGLRETFDIRNRFRNLDYKLQIAKENLQLFTELIQHKESSRLEWIIIVLILFEVIHLIINLIIKL